MRKEEVKQWLINDGQVPEGCDNNEYWNHWYDVISRMTQEQGQTLPLDSVSKRYQVTDIQLADWESVAIGDTETNKVVCHFLTENGFDEAVKMANKIADYLNVC